MPSHFLRQCPLPSFADEIFPRSFVVLPRQAGGQVVASAAGSSAIITVESECVHQGGRRGAAQKAGLWRRGARDFVNDLEKLNSQMIDRPYYGFDVVLI